MLLVLMLLMLLMLMLLLLLPMPLRRCHRLQSWWPPQWRLPVSDCSKEQEDR
jgi:hypothetical protein